MCIRDRDEPGPPRGQKLSGCDDHGAEPTGGLLRPASPHVVIGDDEYMATPVLSTKLFVPPQRPEVVPRVRLVDQLYDARAAGRKLSLVAAPAGFGKTTVV